MNTIPETYSHTDGDGYTLAAGQNGEHLRVKVTNQDGDFMAADLNTEGERALAAFLRQRQQPTAGRITLTLDVPAGPVVTFNRDAAAAWLAGPGFLGYARSQSLGIHPGAEYDPTEDSVGSWLNMLLNELSTERKAPHVWTTAPGVKIEVVETVHVEGDAADGGALIVVEIGGVRFAAHQYDSHGYAPEERQTQSEAALAALESAARIVNGLVDHLTQQS